MIFSYWSAPTRAATPKLPSTRDWTLRGYGRALCADEDVLPGLARRGADLPDLFRAITIPACKADVARLVLLADHGGLYVDTHAGPHTRRELTRALKLLGEYELVLFDHVHEHAFEGDFHIVNGAIAARAGSAILEFLLDSAFANLREQLEAETASNEHVPYNIVTLTGAWDLSVRLFDRSLHPPTLRPEFEGRIVVESLGLTGRLPFHLYKHYGYRRPGDHWSERQQVERLFAQEYVEHVRRQGATLDEPTGTAKGQSRRPAESSPLKRARAGEA